jgi:hypothetical protein
VVLALVSAGARGQDPLPEVSDADWPILRKQVFRLLPALEKPTGPLSEESLSKLRALLERESANPGKAAAAVQKLLDRHCLVGVSINPESRVKAARGPAPARLYQGQENLVLVRVHNEAGVTHALAVHSPQLITAGQKGAGRWLEARVVGEARLSGGKLDYRLLELKPHESGKREATLQLDVGQGTQDLGFRAETPILFTIHKGRQRP